MQMEDFTYKTYHRQTCHIKTYPFKIKLIYDKTYQILTYHHTTTLYLSSNYKTYHHKTYQTTKLHKRYRIFFIKSCTYQVKYSNVAHCNNAHRIVKYKFYSVLNV